MSDNLTETLDRAFAWAVAQPLRERGYTVGRRHARRRKNDLFLWVQLFGLTPGQSGSRDFELRGGVAVEACLPFTRSPSKPWQWSQTTVWWQSIYYRYAPDGPPGRGVITSAEQVVETLRDEAARFLAEVDREYRSSEDVREALWNDSADGDPRQAPQHLAVLLAHARDLSRLGELRQRHGVVVDEIVQRLPNSGR